MSPLTRFDYRQQISQLAKAMALPGQLAGTAAPLVSGSQLAGIEMFVDGNTYKRYEKLNDQLDFLRGGFENLDRLIDQYVHQRPLSAYDDGMNDGELFCRWLKEHAPLSPEQSDYIVCQQARHAIEQQARLRRLEYVRFQDLYSMVDRSIGQRTTVCSLQLRLNPVRLWRQLQTTALLEATDTAPANVLFFAVQGEIRTAVFELEGQALVNELADFSPCTIAQWSALTACGDSEQLVESTYDLAEMGLVALG